MNKRPLKDIPLSVDLERVVLSALLAGSLTPEGLRSGELSKPGRVILEAVKRVFADGGRPPYDASAISVLASDVLGGEREEIASIMADILRTPPGSGAATVLNQVAERRLLADVLNSVSEQLTTGKLDLVGLRGLLDSHQTSGGDLVPIAEMLSGGFPHLPSFLPLKSLPRLTEKVGGLYGLWAIAGEPKIGKALAPLTPVPTPGGWVPMGSLQVGDRLFGGNGLPCTVVATRNWSDRPSLRVGFSDGGVIVADVAHEWVVRRRTGQRKTVRCETGDLRSRDQVPCVALEGEARDVPIPPYTLGAWLGDGTSDSAAITCGDQDRDFFVRELKRDNIPVRPVRYGVAWRLRLSDGDRSQKARDRSVAAALRASGVLGNKHIPPHYLRASIEQRLALLQGLMDTDGHVTRRGYCEYTTTSPQLRDGVAELIRSLGFLVHVREGRAVLNGKDTGPKWRLFFVSDRQRPACRLPRKYARLPQKRKSLYKSIVSVSEGARTETVCIQVDSPTGLFLAGEGMTPTHNSTLAWQLAIESGQTMPVLYYDFENGFPVLISRIRTVYDDNLERVRRATRQIFYRPTINTLEGDLSRVQPPAFIVVDSVQKLPVTDRFAREGLDRWVHKLEAVKKAGYTMLMVSEVPKSFYGALNPSFGANKGSGEIEFSADTGFHLLKHPDGTELHVVANRHGPYVGRVSVLRRTHGGWWFTET